ncbi:GAF domain-containing protein [Cyanobacteria bacterium FACHB-DQ100]|nr:GAF domain-containing protein [Cyanobacteria bacterium FACHB-DQ100]
MRSMQSDCVTLGASYPLDGALNTAPCGFLTFTEDSRIVVVNATLLHLLGYELDELRGQQIEVILPIASRIFYQTHFFPLLKLHGKVEEVYISMKSKQGDALPILLNAVRREHADVTVNDCVCVLMHQRNRYEDELLQAKKDAEVAICAQKQTNALLQQSQIELERKQTELSELNAKLEELVQQRTAQLQQALEFEALLKRITDKVRDSLDEQEILRSAVRELAQGLGTLCCDTGIYSADQTTSTIVYEVSHVLAPAQEPTMSLSNSPHAGVFQRLLQGQVSQFCDITSDSVRPDQRFLVVLACPLMDDQGVLGDLWLFKPCEAEFNEQEVRLVQQVANQCAIALRQSRLYRAVQVQVEELARLNRLKDDFLSTVSHELRTPISSMKMAIQMLDIRLRPLGLLNSQTNSISRYFQILQTECEREISLINDLLDLTRIDSGAEPLNLTSIQFKSWINQVAVPFLQRTADQEQHLKLSIPDDLPLFTTDLVCLERILTELLHNAFKYTPPSETITIAARLETDNLNTAFLIEVSNSGVEIPVIEHDRIFDKFYRIPKHDPWKHGGTGLGLSLVKKLVARLGGIIWVESGDRLTKFILQFPLNQQA